MKLNFRKIQCKIQVKNIVLWLKIILFIIFICNLNSQLVPLAQSNLMSLIFVVLQCFFNPVFYRGHWVAAKYFNSRKSM